MEDFTPFLTKGKDWAYETEWRLMLPLATAARIVGEGPTAIHLFAFPKTIVRGVIVGCRMSALKKEEIRNILSETPEYGQAYCAEARIDERHYRIRITRGSASCEDV